MRKGFQFKMEFEERQRRPREIETYLISHLMLRGLKKKKLLHHFILYEKKEGWEIQPFFILKNKAIGRIKKKP